MRVYIILVAWNVEFDKDACIEYVSDSKEKVVEWLKENNFTHEYKDYYECHDGDLATAEIICKEVE